MAEDLAKLLSIFHQSSLTREVPDDWMLDRVMAIYKKGQKEDLGNPACQSDSGAGVGYGKKILL